MKAWEGDGVMIAFSYLYPVRALAHALMKNKHISTSHCKQQIYVEHNCFWM